MFAVHPALGNAIPARLLRALMGNQQNSGDIWGTSGPRSEHTGAGARLPKREPGQRHSPIMKLGRPAGIRPQPSGSKEQRDAAFVVRAAWSEALDGGCLSSL